jgi:periplasmic divalent cation tolerance protein
MSAQIVFCTVPNRKEADRLARTLVQEKLAACVNIIPGISSIYRWQGKIEKSAELLLVLKTSAKRYPRLEKRIRALHSYTVPEILALPVDRGNSDYLKWLYASLSPSPAEGGRRQG